MRHGQLKATVRAPTLLHMGCEALHHSAGSYNTARGLCDTARVLEDMLEDVQHSAKPAHRAQVVRALQRLGAPWPVALVVSGNRAPCLAGAENDVDPTRLHTLDEGGFWEAFEARYGTQALLVS
jgi:hypothetical protein